MLHDNMTDSMIIKEKFPNGVSGTPLGAPSKGLYCLGFWRGLPADIVGVLCVHGAVCYVCTGRGKGALTAAGRALLPRAPLPAILAPECETLPVCRQAPA